MAFFTKSFTPIPGGSELLAKAEKQTNPKAQQNQKGNTLWKNLITFHIFTNRQTLASLLLAIKVFPFEAVNSTSGFNRRMSKHNTNPGMQWNKGYGNR